MRFGIPYGPRAREAAVIPAFVNKAFRRAADARRRRAAVTPLRLRRGPRRRRRARSERVADNRVYNLASDENVTIKQIAETVQELIGDSEIVYTPARLAISAARSSPRPRRRESLDGPPRPRSAKASPLRRLAP